MSNVFSIPIRYMHYVDNNHFVQEMRALVVTFLLATLIATPVCGSSPYRPLRTDGTGSQTGGLGLLLGRSNRGRSNGGSLGVILDDRSTDRKSSDRGSLGAILDGMKQILDFARSFTGHLIRKKASSSSCPVITCTEKIPTQCRRSVYYNIRGRRCSGCDVDICKVQRRRESNAMIVPVRIPQEPATFLPAFRQDDLTAMPFENRWMQPREIDTFDATNSFSPLGNAFNVDDARLFPSRDSDFPRGWENSWITNPIVV